MLDAFKKVGKTCSQLHVKRLLHVSVCWISLRGCLMSFVWSRECMVNEPDPTSEFSASAIKISYSHIIFPFIWMQHLYSWSTRKKRKIIMLIERAHRTHRMNSVLILYVCITCWISALWVRDGFFLCILLLAATAVLPSAELSDWLLCIVFFCKYIWHTLYSAHVLPCCPAVSRFGMFSTSLMLINPPLWCSQKSWVHFFEVGSLSVFKFQLNQGSGKKYARSLLHWGSLGQSQMVQFQLTPSNQTWMFYS